jgi:hypothetical protein
MLPRVVGCPTGTEAHLRRLRDQRRPDLRVRLGDGLERHRLCSQGRGSDRKNIAYRAVTAATLRLKVVCAEEHKPIVP